MNRIDSLLLLHRRLDEETITPPASSRVVSTSTSAVSLHSSLSTLNSVREEKEEDDNGQHDDEHAGHTCTSMRLNDDINMDDEEKDESDDSDLVVGFPSEPRRSSLGKSDVNSSSSDPKPTKRRSSLRCSSSPLVQAPTANADDACNSKNSQKSVRFILPSEDPVAIHYIESILDMSPDEISCLWITPQERAAINRRNKETVKGMRKSRSENDLNLLGQTSRGLEHLQSSRVLRALAQSQRDLIDAVLHLQSIHAEHRKGRTNNQAQEDDFAGALGRLSQQLSLQARNRAVKVAEADAATAALIAAMELQEEEQDSTSTTAPTSSTTAGTSAIHSSTTNTRTSRSSDDLRRLRQNSEGLQRPPTNYLPATTRPAYLNTLQQTLELSIGSGGSTSSVQGGAASVASEDSPLCF